MRKPLISSMVLILTKGIQIPKVTHFNPYGDEKSYQIHTLAIHFVVAIYLLAHYESREGAIPFR